ncbi:hypothetical protein K9N68_08435 [Kovacikia minuta CCNUW1]|uniref:hypothetical protein n=1 Tax=Kovacikia minuta TaxID=2931930 RepID=UPI001CCEACC0|nr:hypothetical protein [Kovacikia minuta]UBF27910.1 hypothetical protein K9N68_08435 [Kovacikia minuta CCNUW1]
MKVEQNQAIHFALCLNNEGYKASLEVGKLYRIVADEQAAAHGLIRIIDESGEDYAFSADRFYPVELPQSVEKLLLKVS